MNLDLLISRWQENISIELWKMFLIGTIFLLMDFVLFLVIWMMQFSAFFEYGKPKWNRKRKKKVLQSFSLLDKLLLFKLIPLIKNKGIFLWIIIFCQYINLMAFVSSCIGFVGSLITCAEGWALTLLVLSQIGTFAIVALIEFIPSIIYLPSERRRYRI